MKKSTYQKPELIQYGDIEQLTQAAGGLGSDAITIGGVVIGQGIGSDPISVVRVGGDG